MREGMNGWGWGGDRGKGVAYRKEGKQNDQTSGVESLLFTRIKKRNKISTSDITYDQCHKFFLLMEPNEARQSCDRHQVSLKMPTLFAMLFNSQRL